ncbi:MAG: hypothetical protein ACFCUM_17145 [Bacteroidales bacterium]
MKNSFNFKFILLTILIGIVGFLLRPIFLTFSLDSYYLNFLAGVFALLFIYFLSVSISPKQHNWKSAISLVVGVMIIYSIIYYGEYDRIFYTRIGGMIFSLALISLTLSKKAKKWFLPSKSLYNEME